jgi:hypothetical protein
MKAIIFCAILFCVLPVVATDYHIGSELDAFPYLTGGYYFSLWGGNNTYHLRTVVAHSNIPNFVIPDGFTDESTDVCALIIDRFLDPRRNGRGWWMGTGFEYWRMSIRNEENREHGHFNEAVYTLGGGYVIPIYRNITLNPWVAGHVILNPKAPKIGGIRPDVAPVLGEGSLKIGIQW